MKKRIFSILLCFAMVLTLLPTTALATYTVTGSIATVSTLADLTVALDNPNVTEIIVSRYITLKTGTKLEGKGQTVRAAVTGVNESGVVQTESESKSDYCVFDIASNATVSISNLTIMGGDTYAIYNAGTLTMNNVVVTRSGSASCEGGGIGNNGGTLYAVNSIITDNYYCSNDSTVSVQASDIGFGGTDNLYYCVHGTLTGDASLSGNVGNQNTKAGVFAKYRNAGILSGNGTMTSATYDHPVLANASGLLYAPLASNSPAASGGVYATYFDYSNLNNIKMSYKATAGGDETGLGGLLTGGTQVTGYIEKTSGRTSGVIGASDRGGESGYSTVTIANSANGSVSGSVSGGTVYGDTYSSGETVTLTAIPDAGYYFEQWTNANAETISLSNPYTFTAASDITVQPNFITTPTYTVTLNSSAGIADYETSENGTNYETYCGPYTVTTGGSLYIKANIDEGYTFSKWADDVTDNPYKLESITTDVSYTPTLSTKGNTVTENSGIYYHLIKNCTLTFDTNGGSAVSNLVQFCDSIADLADCQSTLDGYTFDGWYADQALTERVISVKLTKDATVYAKWILCNPFTDVAEGAYYADAVAWAVQSGVAHGRTATLFKPDGVCTRAQAVTFM